MKLKIIAIISWLLTIAQLTFFIFIKNLYSIDTTEASSIGIIGGADGPTAIFVSTNNTGLLYSFFIICAFIAIISTIILIIKRVERNRTV